MPSKIQLSNVQLQELYSRILTESDPGALEELTDNLERLLRARQEILAQRNRVEISPARIQ
jgi:hypothetical protein